MVPWKRERAILAARVARWLMNGLRRFRRLVSTGVDTEGLHPYLRAAVEEAGPRCTVAQLAKVIERKAQTRLIAMVAAQGEEWGAGLQAAMTAGLGILSAGCAAQVLAGVKAPTVDLLLEVDPSETDLHSNMGRILGQAVGCAVWMPLAEPDPPSHDGGGQADTGRGEHPPALRATPFQGGHGWLRRWRASGGVVRCTRR